MKSILFILIAFVAVTSAVSGLLLFFNPEGSLFQLQAGLLEGTPFNDFRLPGLILALLVGGINALAVFFNLQRHRRRYQWAMAGGFILCGWVTGQWLLLNQLHWLQFLYFGIGILIILTAYQLQGKWAV